MLDERGCQDQTMKLDLSWWWLGTTEDFSGCPLWCPKAVALLLWFRVTLAHESWGWNRSSRKNSDFP